MRLLEKIFGLFSRAPEENKDISYRITVRCDRCGEIIQSRVNLSESLSADYDNDGNITTYFCRKVLIGKENCFRPIEVILTFDSRRRLTDRQITGGHFVEV
jgi:hypothetical protein